MGRIYQTVADMQRFHFESCVAIPPKVLQVYKSLKTTRPRGVGSPQSYWDKSAREIGLVDTEEGIQVNVKKGGEKEFERQLKNVLTGLLQSVGPGNQQGQQDSVTCQSRTIQSQIQVKEEEVPLEASLRGPQHPLATSAVPAAVVSSPGSDSISNYEAKNNHGGNAATIVHDTACLTPGASAPVAPNIPYAKDKTDCTIANDENNIKQDVATTTSVEAEEDANMLLMLKQTPESPPRDKATVAENTTAVMEEGDTVSVAIRQFAV